MARSNYTAQNTSDCNGAAPAPFSLAAIRQNPQIGNIQSILKGKEDQAVMVMRVLVALSEVAGREVDCNPESENPLVKLYRQNIDELAMIARAVLSPTTQVRTNG